MISLAAGVVMTTGLEKLVLSFSGRDANINMCVCVCVCVYTQTSHHVYLLCRKPWIFQSSASASPSNLVKISFRALNQLEGRFGVWFLCAAFE